MTTATVDNTELTDIDGISDSESYVSRLNSAIGLSDTMTESTEVVSNYFYSAGSFHVLIEKGFKAETLESAKLTSVPFLPVWHMGIISIHGIIMPVIDIFSFIREQSISVEKPKKSKSYLLKLEHNDHSPIVFKVDALPKLINIDSFKNTKADEDSPDWIKNYLEDDTTKLATVDHQKLFANIINTQ